ncbi:MAG: alpha/beta fold hydrolase [Deltaproteobacteria bacterium]|nr:alpha/beta fold hydrolase [Deltaproteobacteria bacterium]
MLEGRADRLVALTCALAGAWASLASCGSGATPEGSVADAGADASLDAAFDAAPDAAADAAADSAPDAAPGLGPPYPIVLAHGFGGFDEVGPIDYFWRVAETLGAEGEQIHVSQVAWVGSSEARGAELLAFVQEVLAETGAARAVIVGHSQGGLDARVVAHAAPEAVAAVVTIATPHQGTPVADVVLGYAPGFSEDLANAVFDLFGRIFYGDEAQDADVRTALELFSEPGIAAFNEAYPDAEGVSYFSITGRSALRWALEDCSFDDRPSFITDWDSQIDPRDALLAVPGVSLDPDGPNDGLVPVDSARWGRFLGCVPADHLDEVGQLMGDSPGGTNDFDHLDFYRGLVAFLREQGF